MGYTHYHYHKRSFTDTEWQSVMKLSEDIIRTATAAEVKLAGPMGDGAPEITSVDIALNGASPDDCESFVLEKSPIACPDRHYEDGAIAFAFCKTRCEPYDAVVVSILSAVRNIFPDVLIVHSDGGEEAIRRIY